MTINGTPHEFVDNVLLPRATRHTFVFGTARVQVINDTNTPATVIYSRVLNNGARIDVAWGRPGPDQITISNSRLPLNIPGIIIEYSENNEPIPIALRTLN